jgi:diacylglycerol O-acyltransferase / wax synthase
MFRGERQDLRRALKQSSANCGFSGFQGPILGRKSLAMGCTRLSGLDASFLSVETPTAHMHVGWVALFSPPADGGFPSFEELRDHIGHRLARAPRYRQKLAPVPFGLNAPEWVDDDCFAVDRHVFEAEGPLSRLVDEIMSVPLRRDRPLWEFWVCSEASEDRLAIIGKAHHCMVDGIAAVELGSLLLDATPETAAPEPDDWQPAPLPSGERLVLRGMRDLVSQQLGLARWPMRAASAPANTARQTAGAALRIGRALGHAVRAAPASSINGALSPLRRLAWTQRPLDDLQKVKRTYDTTVNDVMLAAVTGAIRARMIRRGEYLTPLKAMVPVNVRSPKDVLGNHISFVFADLPCDEPDPLGRLYRVHATMSQRKRDGEPEGADLALKAAEHTPGVVQNAISRIVASPRTFNLVVSNIPGPSDPLYMLGCPLHAVYPVVPLAEEHAVSIGMTTIHKQACFGVYADRASLPDAHLVAADIDHSITELLGAGSHARFSRKPGAGTRSKPADARRQDAEAATPVPA